MSELISKDAALGCFTDWIDRYGHEHTADEDPVYQRIAELPAVQLECKPECKPMYVDVSDTISRQVAIDALDCINGAEEVLRAFPSVQPEIIRCKDCKHRDKYGCCKYWKGLAMADIPIATDDYDFCSYAKRI